MSNVVKLTLFTKIKNILCWRSFNTEFRKVYFS